MTRMIARVPLGPPDRRTLALAAAWKQFTAAGGVSGNDFIPWMRQGRLERAPARTRRHLRLIATQPTSKHLI